MKIYVVVDEELKPILKRINDVQNPIAIYEEVAFWSKREANNYCEKFGYKFIVRG